MLRTLTILINAAILFFCSFTRAEEAPVPATPSRWVTDTVGLLSAETQQALDKRLADHEKKSGMRVAVWIGTTVGDAALETWTASAIQAWKVREKAFADGVVLFILTQDRAIDVEVAPGLEKQLSNEFVSQMIFEQMAPRLNQNDANGAVTAGVDALISKLDIQKPEAVPNESGTATPKATEPPETPANSTKTPTEKTTKAPVEPGPMFRMPSILLLVALGALILLSTVAIGAVGWPRRPNNRS